MREPARHLHTLYVFGNLPFQFPPRPFINCYFLRTREITLSYLLLIVYFLNRKFFPHYNRIYLQRWISVVKFPPGHSWGRWGHGFLPSIPVASGQNYCPHDYRLENDEWACRVAALVFDACTECCDDFELWDGARLVTSREGLKIRNAGPNADAASPRADPDAAASQEEVEAVAATILEAVMKASPALHASPRLRSRVNALRRPPAAPQ